MSDKNQVAEIKPIREAAVVDEGSASRVSALKANSISAAIGSKCRSSLLDLKAGALTASKILGIFIDPKMPFLSGLGAWMHFLRAKADPVDGRPSRTK